MVVRAAGIWEKESILTAAYAYRVPDERIGSLQYRLAAEDMLAVHALTRPYFGWGTWGRNHPAEMGHDVERLATDGLWIIALGQRGVVGLVALTAVFLLPMARICRRLPVSTWSTPEMAPGVALSLVLTLFLIDSLFNAMVSPLYTLAAGAVTGWIVRMPMRPAMPSALPRVLVQRPSGPGPVLRSRFVATNAPPGGSRKPISAR
jgi:hypothetical protein